LTTKFFRKFRCQALWAAVTCSLSLQSTDSQRRRREIWRTPCYSVL